MGVQKFFRKVFGGIKRKLFGNFIMNCFTIVLIRLYSSIVLLNQKSLKLMIKDPLSFGCFLAVGEETSS